MNDDGWIESADGLSRRRAAPDAAAPMVPSHSRTVRFDAFSAPKVNNEPAVFSILLPCGGYFRATWPRSISLTSLRMLRDMLTLTLDWWIEKVGEADAAELEYASWNSSGNGGVSTSDSQTKPSETL
jgi:hypothetical protein